MGTFKKSWFFHQNSREYLKEYFVFPSSSMSTQKGGKSFKDNAVGTALDPTKWSFCVN